MSTTTEKNKGGLKAWTTSDQKAWLNLQIPDFIASKGSGSQTDFWAATFEHWFTEWPLGDPTEKEVNLGLTPEERLKKKKMQIKEWFKNHSRASASGNEGRRKLLDLSGKKLKKLPDWQAYSKLYYDAKLKEVIQARWAVKYLADNPQHNPKEPIPPPPLSFRNAETKNLLAQESDGVKEEVERARDQAGADDTIKLEDDDNLDIEERARRRNAVRMQTGLESLNLTMSTVLDQIYTTTGLVGMAIFAGPEPAQAGNICVLEFHKGRSAAGNDFGLAYKDYLLNVRKPFHDFASGIFPPSVRMTRALPGTEHLANYVVNPSVNSFDVKSTSQRSASSAPSLRDVTPNAQLAANSKKVKPHHPRASSKAGSRKKRRGSDSGVSTEEEDPWRSEDGRTTDESDEAPPFPYLPPPVDGEPAYLTEKRKNIEKRKAMVAELQAVFGEAATTIDNGNKGRKGGEKKSKDLSAGSEPPRRSARHGAEGVATAAVTAPLPANMLSNAAPLMAHKPVGIEANSNSVVTSDTPLPSITKTNNPTGAEFTPNSMAAPDTPPEAADPTIPSPSIAKTPPNATRAHLITAPGPVDTPPVSGTVANPSKPASAPATLEERLYWPEWLKKHVAGLEQVGGPSELKEIIRMLPILDAALGHPTGQSKGVVLSKIGRPGVIGLWISGGRKLPPSIKDLPAYITSWKSWWCSLQPSSRVQSGSTILRKEVEIGEVWEELQKGSINGFFNVVHHNFLDMASDVLWVMKQMISGLQLSGKRVRAEYDEMEHDVRPKRAKRPPAKLREE